MDATFRQEVVEPLRRVFGAALKQVTEAADGCIVIHREGRIDPADTHNTFLYIWDVVPGHHRAGGSFKVQVVYTSQSWARSRFERACPSEWAYTYEERDAPELPASEEAASTGEGLSAF